MILGMCFYRFLRYLLVTHILVDWNYVTVVNSNNVALDEMFCPFSPKKIGAFRCEHVNQKFNLPAVFTSKQNSFIS
ncbi:MAG: hypothetical protein PARBA_02995 [Parabacteroides sp.]